MSTDTKPSRCRTFADLALEFNDREDTLVRVTASFHGSAIVVALITKDTDQQERRVAFVVDARTIAGVIEELDRVAAFFATLEAATTPTE